jgi:hypothetical protein
VGLGSGTAHDVRACWFGVDLSIMTCAIEGGAVPARAAGCTIAWDVRLCSLAEVVEHLGVKGRAGIIDGTEIRGYPAAGRKDRDEFVSSKAK